MEITLAILLRAVNASLPLLIACMGQILVERSGVLSLGVEGMIAMGALGAFMGSALGGPITGMLVAMLFGAIMGLLHAGTSVGLKVNQTVSGLAISMIGIGLASLIGKPFIGKAVAAGMEKFQGLKDFPLLGPIISGFDAFFPIAVVLTFAVWFFLKHTRPGLALRNCGENPKAAQAAGINVQAIRTWACVAGGALSGLAGSYLILSYQNSWIEGLSAGRGWIVIALAIFALWRPFRAVGGSLLFGLIFVLQFILQPPIVLPFLAQPIKIPSNLLSMLPYASTLIVMIVYGLTGDQRKLLAPAALGEPFRRGER